MESSSNKAGKEAVFRQSLMSGSDEYIIATLEELRESGENYMVDAIVNLLFTPRSDKMKDAIVNFLVDLKSQPVVPEITRNIRDNSSSDDVARLVSVCWQSRLNFSGDIDLFVELLCKSNYETSLEAFTVIENSLESTNREKLTEISRTLELEKGNTPTEKQLLIEETIKMINEFLAV